MQAGRLHVEHVFYQVVQYIDRDVFYHTIKSMSVTAAPRARENINSAGAECCKKKKLEGKKRVPRTKCVYSPPPPSFSPPFILPPPAGGAGPVGSALF